MQLSVFLARIPAHYEAFLGRDPAMFYPERSDLVRKVEVQKFH
jgi:hypothetical protein